jgi:hypothetical protein
MGIIVGGKQGQSAGAVAGSEIGSDKALLGFGSSTGFPRPRYPGRPLVVGTINARSARYDLPSGVCARPSDACQASFVQQPTGRRPLHKTLLLLRQDFRTSLPSSGTRLQSHISASDYPPHNTFDTINMSASPSSPTLEASPSQPSSKYHAGNVPTLPQTKCCTLCPAKFTRTTHLNRHLRSHTNERLYHCNVRSLLLASAAAHTHPLSSRPATLNSLAATFSQGTSALVATRELDLPIFA